VRGVRRPGQTRPGRGAGAAATVRRAGPAPAAGGGRHPRAHRKRRGERAAGPTGGGCPGAPVCEYVIRCFVEGLGFGRTNVPRSSGERTGGTQISPATESFNKAESPGVRKEGGTCRSFLSATTNR